MGKAKMVKENINESDLDWFKGDNEKHDPNDWEDEDERDRPGLVRELTALFEEAAQIGFSLEELQEITDAALNEVDWEEIDNYRKRHESDTDHNNPNNLAQRAANKMKNDYANDDYSVE